MCGLCGFTSYADKKIEDLHSLTNALMDSSETRGTDASGIAYCDDGRVLLCKASKRASQLNFKPPAKIRALIGHTRHTTQGSERKNYNNHPFSGRTKNASFALAHNGVLFREHEVQKKHHLPRTKIETDSYVAVQLIEKQGVLNHDSMKFMAETIEGSFSFSLLDDKNNVHLIKGDSPLSLLHFPSERLYVYASTDEILWKGLVETALFPVLKAGKFEPIPIDAGDILTIAGNGERMKSRFDYREMAYCSQFDWRSYGHSPMANPYLDDLKAVASSMGYEPELVDDLLAEGVTCEEIEDYLYDSVWEV